MFKKIRLSALLMLASSGVYGGNFLYNATDKEITLSIVHRSNTDYYKVNSEEITKFRKTTYRNIPDFYMCLKGYKNTPFKYSLLQEIEGDKVLIAEEDTTAADKSGLKLSVMSKNEFETGYESVHEVLSKAIPKFSNDLIREVEKHFFGEKLLAVHEKRAKEKKKKAEEQAAERKQREEPEAKAAHDAIIRPAPVEDRPPLAQPAPAIVPGQPPVPAIIPVRPEPAAPALPRAEINRRQWWNHPYLLGTGAALAVIGSLIAAKKIFDWVYPRARSA